MEEVRGERGNDGKDEDANAGEERGRAMMKQGRANQESNAIDARGEKYIDRKEQHKMDDWGNNTPTR